MSDTEDLTSMRAIGERLRLTRDALGLTQERFCARLTLDWIYRGDPSGLKYATANAIKALKNSRG